MIADVLAACNPFSAFRPQAATSGVANPAQWFIDWIHGGGTSDSGIPVTGETALHSPAFWQGVNAICGDVGQLPLNVYERTGDDDRDKSIDRNHQAFKLMRRLAHPPVVPNSYRMQATTFKEILTFHTLIWGNGIAEIERDNSNRPLRLTPLLPDATSLEMVEGRLWYLTWIKGKPYKLRPSSVFHIMGLSMDGLWGIPVWEQAKNSIGLGLAQEKFANKLFGNGAKPGGILKHPGKLKPEAAAHLRSQWEGIHEGLDKQGRTAVLEEGMDYVPMSFSNEDAQLIEGRKFQRTEAASWLNLPPHKVNDLERATFSNIEEQNHAYLNQSLMRWLVKWQDECNDKLLTRAQKDSDSHYFEFNTAALLRGTLKARYEAYRIALGGQPFMSVNDVRRLENMNTEEGHDDIPTPLNMGNSGGKDNEPEESPPAEPAGDDTARAAVRSQVLHMIGVEQHRILDAAEKSPNFCDWVQNWYPAWGDRMAKVVDSLGGDPLDGSQWASDSLDEVLVLTGVVTQDGLQDGLRSVFATWSDRTEQLIDSILGVKT